MAANSVPAAAVRQRPRALGGITGLKACVGGPLSARVKSPGSTGERPGILAVLGQLGVIGTNGGAVKCVDIVWNADGENR